MTDRATAMWAARRVAAEDYGLPFALLAQIYGGSEGGLDRQATARGWKVRTQAQPSRTERIARLSEKLLARVERLRLLADEDAEQNDKDVAELSGAIRLLAKIADSTQDEDSAHERRMVRDADIAAILERLDGKIVELARHLAEALAQEGVFDAPAGAGEP